MNRFPPRPFGLSPQRRALLEALLQQESLEASAVPAISRRPPDIPLPLSFAQQRFWFLEQWEPGSAVSTIARAFSLHGALNRAILEQSLEEIVQRHEVLRTTFVLRDGQPEQVISSIVPEVLAFVDLGDLLADERAVQVERLSRELAQHPFNLAQGPLLRALLLSLSPAHHEFLLTLHHSVCDGWSLNLFLSELSLLYQAGMNAQPFLLPELPLQYADYALWQHQWLQGAVLADQRAYWRQRLEEAPVVLELPTNYPRPAVQTFRGSHVVFPLPRELAQAVREMSQQAGVTVFMTLLTAFAALLLRYSRQEDFVIGTPLAHRPQRVLEGLIGCFTNTLALRLDLSGRPDFATLLDRVRETCLEAYAHQGLPFEKLIEALAPERAISHTPLFQVMFALQDQSWNTLHLAGLSVQEPEIVSTGTARVDLLLTVIETSDGLNTRFEYRTDLFEKATIARMSSHFQLMLERMVDTPQMRLDVVPLLSKAEQHLLLQNGRPASPVDSRGLHQLIEAQVVRTPEALALVWGEDHLTYDELNRRANQLAHHLLELGVGSEHLVGVRLPRSPGMVIALLAALKTGGAYVPLDPRYPAERLAFMLQDSQASLLLTLQQVEERDGALPFRALTLHWETPHGERTENPGRAIPAESLAYVIYTSGSTGQPKGVALTHRGASALLSWARQHFSSQQLARVLASTSICFDLSIFELWVPLACGGTVLLAEDVLQGFDRAEEQAVTLLNTVPSALTALLSLGDLPTSLTSVNLAGEALSAHLVQQTYARGMVEQVFNLYGPSEDTTYSTWALLTADTSDPVSIGRPISHSEVYLLDAQGQPVPIGVAGELFLGGAGLARGYLGQPALTAECFVPHPWSRQPGQRLYRTGDLARYRPDGSLEFVGRADTQVKLRGYRIELGEIEALIRQHPLVGEAVVLLREDVVGKPYLASYVVPQKPLLALEEVRDWLTRKVPDYMVPTAWVLLERLPLSPNGKVDRRALPAPDGQRSREETSFTAPRTAIEEMVAGIWAEVLKLEYIGIYDNFFEIGGHSLLATQVIARLREALQREVPLHSLFEAPTIAKLAQRLERTLLAEAPRSTPSIHTGARPNELPLSFAQQRFWFLEQWAPGMPTYNLPISLRLSGYLRVGAFTQALGEIVRRHETLRTAFTMHGSSPVQQISSFRLSSLAVVDLTGLLAEQREGLALQLISQEMLQPFDLARGPLWRAGLVRLEDEEHMLWWTLHHSIVDGWSLGVLVRELSTLYRAIVQEQPSPLPEVEVQYADYVLWQRRWLSPELLETSLAYWKQQLQGAPSLLELPTDRLRPAVQTFAGDHYRFALPPELSSVLVTMSRQEGVTLFMTLLAAWQTLLFRYSGQDDLLVGTPIANRTHTQLEAIVGCFVNTLVLRGDLSGDPSFRALLGRVREMTLQA
ncbi:MAG TPA: amino acid adenylation domain-containing protein, partial [Ktedonobacteraceae bacterium]